MEWKLPLSDPAESSTGNPGQSAKYVFNHLPGKMEVMLFQVKMQLCFWCCVIVFPFLIKKQL